MFDENLRKNYQYLTKKQRLIADYLLANSQDAVFLSISEMARVLETSASNIFRFAKSIGYKGYPALQSDLQSKIREKVSPVKGLETAKSKEAEIYSEIFKTDAANLRQTQEFNSREAIDQVVEEIINARQVGFVGYRSSQSVAFLLAFFIGRVRRNCQLIDNAFGNLTTQLNNYGPGDLIFGISFPRYGRQTLEVLKYGKKVGCRIISITDNPVSPAGQVSDRVLLAAHKTSAYFNSFSATVSLVNCLVAGVSIKSGSSLEVLKSFDQIDKEWNNFLR